MGSYDPWRAYGQSKLANLQFALELDRRLRAAGRPARSIVVHPGFTHTDLQARSVRETGALRQEVECENATAQGAIHQYLRTNSVRPVFSLRQDFSEAFHRLLHNPSGTPVQIQIIDNYFPAFLTDRMLNVRTLTVTAATLAFRTAPGPALTGLAVSVKGTSLATFTLQSQLGGFARIESRHPVRHRYPR